MLFSYKIKWEYSGMFSLGLLSAVLPNWSNSWFWSQIQKGSQFPTAQLKQNVPSFLAPAYTVTS